MLRLHKLRALLTMLGVIIGVMSVTIIVMLSNGFQYYIDHEFKKLGADTIILAFDPGNIRRGRTVGNIQGLTLEDMDYLKKRVTILGATSPMLMVPTTVLHVGEEEFKTAQIVATDENFPTLNRIPIAKGRHLSASDMRTRANVCVIGDEIAKKLFPDQDPIGRLITLPGITLEVVGVLERMDIMGQTTGRYMLLPLTTAQSKWLGGDTISMITTQPAPGHTVEEAMDAIWQAMMLRSGNRAVYRIDSRESILGVFGSILTVAGAVLAAVAALSLVVGGIGIMNIMLVSVKERTREIGLRMAVGAKRASILTQFLIEAGTLSLAGGLIGMAIAWMLGMLVQFATMRMNWPSPEGLATPFPISAAIVALLFSAFVGMVFGFYPARQAANMDPIAALRYE
jgi:putative ABC transport system permease protein